MASQTRTVNKGRFEDGDVPTGSDYVDLIDSYLSLADTGAQTVTSLLTLSGGIATTTASAAAVVCDTVTTSAQRVTTLGQGTAAPSSGFWMTATEGNARFDIATTTRASGGTGGAVPASAQAFGLVTINGVTYRIALFNN